MKLIVLRWSLSLVLGAPAVWLVLTSRHRLLQGLGVVEALGAVLLVSAPARRLGGRLLLASLLAAAGLHAHAGERPPAAFLVYGAAIAVVTP